MDKKRVFNSIVRGIKNIDIQGARNVAKKALYAYSLVKTASAKAKLLSSRPTEPMMENVLDMADEVPVKNIMQHFDQAQEQINKHVLKLMRKNEIVFTHCHSTNVVRALVYSKKKGRKFEVYNTETRPLFQGRKTARDLKKAKIKVTMFVDSAFGIALAKEQGTKKATKVFLGADALLKKGVVNKVGSEVIARIAREEKIPVYIIADSWKFTKKKIPLENRKLNEIWDKAPKGVKVKNPAFEFIDKKYITGIVTELGVMKYGEFIRKMK